MNARLILLPAVLLFSSAAVSLGTTIHGSGSPASISVVDINLASGNSTLGWNDNLKLGVQDVIGNSIAPDSTYISSGASHQPTYPGSEARSPEDDPKHTRGFATVPENQSTALAFGSALAVLVAVESFNRRKRFA